MLMFRQLKAAWDLQQTSDAVCLSAGVLWSMQVMAAILCPEQVQLHK
jgi:hypothetical protein